MCEKRQNVIGIRNKKVKKIETPSYLCEIERLNSFIECIRVSISISLSSCCFNNSVFFLRKKKLQPSESTQLFILLLVILRQSTKVFVSTSSIRVDFLFQISYTAFLHRIILQKRNLAEIQTFFIDVF